MAFQLEFRHDCQNLGCANTQCNLCKLCQRRRCPTNFAAKYLAPCDVVEAKCGAQIYVVVTDATTGQLVQQGLEDLALLISIIDGRKFESEGDAEDAIERCELLTNKQGQPLLAHGRSGSYTDTKRVMVPMIHGQALLPDLKITDSSEALLTGRAPPFRLAVRAVHRTGEPFHGIAFSLSDPFVVATARVKGAAKLEIPHVDDHVSKIDCVGLQTQKKLEDIRAAAVAAGVPDLNLPINSVVKVGQFRDLVETAERNKALRETLKQVLRLTKGWDVARDHVRRAVETDVQLRVYHPDGRTEVGLVFKCGSFNVIDINRPVGLMRRKQNPQQANQELVDVIWLPLDTASFPDAVKRMLPQASADWRKEGHPGWALLPLTIGHMPPYSEGGKPASQTSSFTFTIRMAPGAAPPPPATNPMPGQPGGIPISPRGPTPGGMTPPLPGMPGAVPNGFGGAGALGLGGLGLGGALGGLGLQAPPQLPAGFVPGGGGGGLDALRLSQQGMAPPLGAQLPPGLPPDLLFGGQQQLGAPGPPPQQPTPPAAQQQQQHFPGLQGLGLGGELPPGLAGLDPATVQGLMQMPTLDLYSAGSAPPGSVQRPGGAPTPPGMQQAAAPQAGGHGGSRPAGHGAAGLPPELAHLLKDDSMSPFEDPNFQQLMSMMAQTGPAGAPAQGGAAPAGPVPGGGAPPVAGPPRGPAPGSGGRSAREPSKQAKRKADTSLETWMEMNKGLDDLSLPGPGPVAPLESLFTSMLPGGELGAGGGSSGPPPQAAAFFSGGAGGNGAPAAKRSNSHSPDGTPGPAGGAGGGAGAGGGTGQRPAASGAAPMDVQQAPDAGQPAQRPAQAGGGDGAANGAVGGGGGGEAAASPAPLVKNITLEQMQEQFARAMRQEITFAELESYLRKYNLLPSGQAGAGAAGAMAAMAAAATAGAATAVGKDASGGLEDMQTIERALPA